MAEMKHTPGPWHVGRRQAGDEDGWADYDEYDRQCGVWAEPAPEDHEYEPYVICQPDSEADARLIAAAPELLEACKTAIHAIDHATSGEHHGIEDEVAEIRAAIFRATGEE